MNTPFFTQASINISNMAQTWNAGATTFTAIKMNVTDTASAAGSSLLDLQVGGVSRFKVDKAGLITTGAGGLTTPQLTFTPNSGITTSLGSANSGSGLVVFAGGTQMMSFASIGPTLGATNLLQWTNAGNNPLTTVDVALSRDGAAGCLAQRVGTAAQAFRVYNTFTDASNYERAFIRWSSNTLQIGAEGLGTGAVTPREVEIGAYGNSNLYLVTAGTRQWRITNGGALFAGSDNVQDIGASGGSRPRNVFVANNITAGGGLVTSMTTGVLFTGGGYIVTPSNGVMKISNNSDTGFNRLQLGGTTSAFPAIKRSGAGIDFRLADDSGLTFIGASTIVLSGGAGAGFVAAGAATTAKPHISLTAGVAPTSPANGDIWFDGTNLNIRIGGVTRTVNVT